jgi:hypothetical protein
MQLRELAHIRTGDKGRIFTISVTAYHAKDFSWLESVLTAERVTECFGSLLDPYHPTERYSLPHLHALNFVLYRPLAQAVTSSLAIDAHGKCLGSALLALEVNQGQTNTYAN